MAEGIPQDLLICLVVNRRWNVRDALVYIGRMSNQGGVLKLLSVLLLMLLTMIGQTIF